MSARRPARAAAALALLGLASASPAARPAALAAQTLRTFTVARQLHGETRLVTRLDYAAGTLRVRPGAAGDLYRMEVTYDEQRFRPVSAYDAPSGTATLGLAPLGGSGLRPPADPTTPQLARLDLSPTADLALDLTLGAVEGDIELGGLHVTSLAVSTGASRTVLHFSAPNAARCSSATFNSGAAELVVVGLGNSRCDAISFEGGMGRATLDFSGAWSASARVAARMRVGELTLRLPRSVGVRLTLDKFLSTFRPAGLTARGTTYESANYATAARRLDLALTTAVGSIKVEWVD
ncbi:MAG TPA: LiaF domain-containing protein [Gemmatimonadales bacterium]|nr:LiaF domain-containing protein [Gemmatimonadales bacterium]